MQEKIAFMAIFMVWSVKCRGVKRGFTRRKIREHKTSKEGQS